MFTFFLPYLLIALSANILPEDSGKEMFLSDNCESLEITDNTVFLGLPVISKKIQTAWLGTSVKENNLERSIEYMLQENIRDSYRYFLNLNLNQQRAEMRRDANIYSNKILGQFEENDRLYRFKIPSIKSSYSRDHQEGILHLRGCRIITKVVTKN
ncbi:MAG: hypothetical protein ACFCU6_14200 [Balneolaceae bacterium]